MNNINITRRNFVKGMIIAGVTVYVAAPFSKAFAELFENNVLQSPNWDPKTRMIRNRLDAHTKITGKKIFAIDIRAKDMPHWPQKQAYAFLIRSTIADRVYQGIDLSILEKQQLMPDKLVTAKNLKDDKLVLPEFFGDDLLLPEGQTPAYLGQAVALLIYEDFDRFKFAKDSIQFRDDVVVYGEETGFLERDPWATYRGVRIGGDTPYSPDVYSAMKYSSISRLGYKKYVPFWPKGEEGGTMKEEGDYYAEQLHKELDNPPEDWLVLDRKFFSQSTDPCAMEPCNSNGWYDADTETLHFVVADQSAGGVYAHIVDFVAGSRFKFKRLILHPCSTVGYGGKGGAIEPMFGVVASLYSGGVPVRFANDRYEQFQSGIKRHSIEMDYRLAVNKKTHKIESFIANCVANGGGRCNYTPGVVAVGAMGGIGRAATQHHVCHIHQHPHQIIAGVGRGRSQGACAETGGQDQGSKPTERNGHLRTPRMTPRRRRGDGSTMPRPR